MKVLWFTNTPSLAAGALNSGNVGGSWIEALEMNINKIDGIELGIAFKWKAPKDYSLHIGKTTYFILSHSGRKNKFSRLIRRWQHSIGDQNALQSYLNIIDEFKPDIIHIFGTESDFGLIIQKTAIPCIIHIQGNLTMCTYKWFSGISFWDTLKHSKKGRLLKGYGLLHDYFVTKKEAEREKQIFKNCHYFMGRTIWDKCLAQCLSPGSVYFHCDEIMREEFYLQQWKKKLSGDFTIISVLRGNIYKGLETILKCQMILSKTEAGKNVIWKIAGLEKNDEIVYLTEKAAKSNLHNNRVILLGKLRTEKLIEEMKNADLFVHPSHIDNSPNGVCEAMLLGMPVIASYVGGIPSLIEDKKEGLLVSDGDPYSLAGAIIELFGNRNYAVELRGTCKTKSRNQA